VECRHYWVIDEAKRKTSKGTCRLCGETAMFDNGPQFKDHPDWMRTEDLELREELQPARFRMHEGAISL